MSTAQVCKKFLHNYINESCIKYIETNTQRIKQNIVVGNFVAQVVDYRDAK